MQPVGPVTTVPLWLLVVIKVEPMTKVQMWVWMPMVQVVCGSATTDATQGV